MLRTSVRMMLPKIDARIGKMQVNPPIWIFKVPGVFFIGKNLLNSQTRNPMQTKLVPRYMSQRLRWLKSIRKYHN